ncbi:ABC transporter permease [Enterocloster lavalensis]|uniref:ABC transporter permease n=1 Tax=Enterocloster lavalensis TaxID=460384 RepID=UPI0023F3D367|nr:ABC transporter permease [Enterocloster lavalensis]
MNDNVKLALYRFRYAIILLAVVLGLTLATPKFFSSNNFLNILWAVSIVGIISMGATFVILVGRIDLSVGQTAALSGITAALLIKGGTPIPAAIAAACCVGAAVGVVNGLLVIQFHVPEFITTLATGSIITGIAQMISRGKTISIMESKAYIFLGSGKIADIPIPIFCFLFSFLIAFFILNYMVLGRKCYAVGGNARAARVSNINVKRVVVFAYVLSGIAAAFGGIILSALNQQASASTASGYELDVIAAIVIGGASMSGGVGTIPGTVFGVVLIGLINNGLNLLSVPGTWHPVVKGVIILAAVAFNNYSIRFMKSQKVEKKTAGAV